MKINQISLFLIDFLEKYLIFTLGLLVVGHLNLELLHGAEDLAGDGLVAVGGGLLKELG